MQAWTKPGAHRAALASPGPFLFKKHQSHPKYAPDLFPIPIQTVLIAQILVSWQCLSIFSQVEFYNLSLMGNTNMLPGTYFSARLTNLKSHLSEGQTTELQR